MRRFLSLFLLAACLGAPAVAFAQSQPSGPVVDVVEIAGIIDRPIARYAIETIDEAERAGDALVVFQVNSLGALKVSDEQDVLPPLVRRIRDARIPIAVHVGPRTARAAGAVIFMGEAAHVFAMGPSTRIGPVHPVDIGRIDRYGVDDETRALSTLAASRGRTLRAGLDEPIGATGALRQGFVDLVTPSVAELLRSIDGRTVTTAAGPVRMRLPSDATTIRFHQPGPIRRLMHTFSNPTLVYVMLIAGALLVVFELFVPGFGVAGVTGGLLLVASAYGLTVLPARGLGVALVSIAFVLYALDIAMDGLGVPTALGTAGLAVGSWVLYPQSFEPVRLAPWLVVAAVVSALIVCVPVMTVVRRARTPETVKMQRPLIGLGGEVRSMLNPEGFVMVADELWRARSETGVRMRVGEQVVVASIDGTVLVVRAAEPSTGPVPGAEQQA